MKAALNKTIDFDLDEGGKYLERCLKLSEPVSAEEITDKTVNGDLRSVADFLPRGFVDLLVADPPYNMNKDFHGGKFRKLPEAEYEAYTESWLLPLLPLLKPYASIYVCCDWRTGIPVFNVLERHCHVRNRITWQREKGRGTAGNWKAGMEDIYFATVSSSYVFNADAVKTRRRVLAPYKKDGEPKDWTPGEQGKFRDTYTSNFWDDMTVPYWSMPENTAHPAQKPEKLLAKLILASSNPGDFVMDPFLGSGTTSVVSKKLGRHYLGIEQNPLYCAWAEKRLEMAETAPEVQGYTDGVFWERNTLREQRAAERRRSAGHDSRNAGR